MKRLKTLAFLILLAIGSSAWAGYDMYGVVSEVQVRPDGGLWFNITPRVPMSHQP